MNHDLIIVFVCEHGAAKSIVAAAHFNKLAQARGLPQRAISRATHPEPELSPRAVAGLLEDGLVPLEAAPQKLEPADVANAQRVVAFCGLPQDLSPEIPVEHWDDVPPVSEDYVQARDSILAHLERFLKGL